jgi:hypothetical protein
VIAPEFPTLYVGDSDLWVKVTDRNKLDLSGVTVTVRLVGPDGVASSWAAPRDVDDAEAVSGVLRVAPSFVAAVVGLWQVQIRISDGVTTATVAAGFFRVVA